MRRFSRTGLAIAAAWVLWAGEAGAQPPGPPRVGGTPAGYSPYLNLIRSRNTPAVNYYGLVRPQQAFQNALFGLQAQAAVGGLAPVLGGGQPDGSDLPGTGLPVGYLNHYGFFLNHGAPGGGTAGRPAGAGGGARAVGPGQVGAGRPAVPIRGR